MTRIEKLIGEFKQKLDFAILLRESNRFMFMVYYLQMCIVIAEKIIEEYKSENKIKETEKWEEILADLHTEKSKANTIQSIPSHNLAKMIHHSTFKICSMVGSGTCFLADINFNTNEYYFVTNKHVVENETRFVIKSEKEDFVLDATIFAVHDRYDLAVVKATIKNVDYDFIPVEFSNQADIIEGTSIYMIGNQRGMGLGFLAGYISRITNDNIFVDVKTCEGTSGSAIYNDKGAVIGINYGTIKEVPVAINCQILIEYLKSIGLKVRVQTRN